jgi:hypothetical protein
MDEAKRILSHVSKFFERVKGNYPNGFNQNRDIIDVHIAETKHKKPQHKITFLKEEFLSSSIENIHIEIKEPIL